MWTKIDGDGRFSIVDVRLIVNFRLPMASFAVIRMTSFLAQNSRILEFWRDRLEGCMMNGNVQRL